MLAIRGDDGAPSLERARRRIRSRLPFVAERLQRLVRLALNDASGPDPEAALAQLEAARRTLSAFLRTTPTG